MVIDQCNQSRCRSLAHFCQILKLISINYLLLKPMIAFLQKRPWCFLWHLHSIATCRYLIKMVSSVRVINKSRNVYSVYSLLYYHIFGGAPGNGKLQWPHILKQFQWYFLWYNYSLSGEMVQAMNTCNILNN